MHHSLVAESMVHAWSDSCRVPLLPLGTPLCSQVQFGQNLLAIQINLNWGLQCSRIKVLEKGSPKQSRLADRY